MGDLLSGDEFGFTTVGAAAFFGEIGAELNRGGQRLATSGSVQRHSIGDHAS